MYLFFFKFFSHFSYYRILSRDGADFSRQTGVHTTYITPYMGNFSLLSSLLPSAYHSNFDRWEE